MTLIKQALLPDRSADRFAFRQAGTDAEHRPPPPEPGASPSPAQSGDQLAELQATVRRLTEELALAEVRIKAAHEDGTREGYKTGIADSARRDQERLELLGETIRESLRIFSARLLQERDIAIELAVATVDTVLGNSVRLDHLVTATATKWAEDLGRSGLVRVRVSAEDFPDEDAIVSLNRTLEAVEVVIDGSLGTGSCFLDLELGYVDASLPVQAEAARSFLLQHAKVAGDAS